MEPTDATPTETPRGDEPWDGSYFVSTYPPFSVWSKDENPAVGVTLAATPPADPPPLGLYVHVPFCVERCQYCYYLSSVDLSPTGVEAYLDAVATELEGHARAPYLRDRRPSFVYFGGGTPSVLDPAAIRRLFGRLRAALPWDRAEEVTFECAPRSATPERLRALREEGVTRISLGVQQLDDAVLAANGRVHAVADVERAWDHLGAEPFAARNLDLIAGMIGETDATFDRTVARVVELAPDSVTIYPLEIPSHTPLHRAVEAATVAADPVGWPTKRARLRRAWATLEAAGYLPRSAYTAGRSPAGLRFLYQDAQYRGADLLGLGASSFSYLGGVHFQNHVPIDRYVEAIRAGSPPLRRAHRLSADERLVRELVLTMKLGRVDLARLRAVHGVDVRARFAATLESQARAGWLEVGGEAVEVTPEGRLRVDRLLAEYYLAEHRGVPAY